jgi:hypothetical protein
MGTTIKKVTSKKEYMTNQPKQTQSAIESESPSIKIGPKNKKNLNKPAIIQFVIWVVIFGLLVFFALAAGSLAGYQSGMRDQRATATKMARTSLDDQFVLAIQDIAESRFEVAYRRLEFVIDQDPAYPGATDKMAEVMAILYATATPTELPPTTTATATRDLRPVEDMYKQAQSLVSEQKWDETIDTLTTLRKEDLAYQIARVDGMFFISLRMRGFDKIWKVGDLEGGIYDMALASRFGPLDAQANSARDLARLYLIGSAFWEVDPAQAIQYFSQVAAAAPGLQDLSGWTASARYREVLIQYGDSLMVKKEWCTAQEQYQLALSMGADASLQEKTQNAALLCSPPSATPTPTGEIPTATTPPAVTPSPTTGNIPPTWTNTSPPGPPTNTTAPPTNTTAPPTNTTEAPTPSDATEAPPEGSPNAPYP